MLNSASEPEGAGEGSHSENDHSEGETQFSKADQELCVGKELIQKHCLIKVTRIKCGTQLCGDMRQKFRQHYVQHKANIAHF